MAWLWFLVLGGIAGWLAGKITRGSGFGLLGDIAIGVIGALVGGFIFRLVGLASFSLLGSLVTSTVGAVAFLYLVRLFKRI